MPKAEECSDGQVGVFLDTPTLEQQPGMLEERLSTLSHLAKRCGLDPASEPFLVYPTLHYQNGGVAIDKDGASNVPAFSASANCPAASMDGIG